MPSILLTGLSLPSLRDCAACGWTPGATHRCMRCPPIGARLPGEPVREESTLYDEDEFLADNADGLDPADVTAIRALKPGESLTIGGGAAAWFEIRRPCKRCERASHVDGICAACNERCAECPRCGCPSGPYCEGHDPGEAVVLGHDAVAAVRASRGAAEVA